VSCLTDKGGLYFTGVWSDGSPAATRSRAKVGYSLGEYLDRGFRKVALAFHGTLDLRKASVGRTIFRQNPIVLKRWGFRLRPVAVRNANNLHRDASCNAQKAYGIPPAGDSSTVWKRKGGNDRAVPLVKCLEASLHARIARGWWHADAKGAFQSDHTTVRNPGRHATRRKRQRRQTRILPGANSLIARGTFCSIYYFRNRSACSGAVHTDRSACGAGMSVARGPMRCRRPRRRQRRVICAPRTCRARRVMSNLMPNSGSGW
jgi:hypothetical protein